MVLRLPRCARVEAKALGGAGGGSVAAARSPHRVDADPHVERMPRYLPRVGARAVASRRSRPRVAGLTRRARRPGSGRGGASAERLDANVDAAARAWADAIDEEAACGLTEGAARLIRARSATPGGRLDSPELATSLQGRSEEPAAAEWQAEADRAQAQLDELATAYAEQLIGSFAAIASGDSPLEGFFGSGFSGHAGHPGVRGATLASRTASAALYVPLGSLPPPQPARVTAVRDAATRTTWSSSRHDTLMAA